MDFKPELNRNFERVELKDTRINSISFRLQDSSTIELRIELKVTALLCDVVSANTVVSVSSLQDKPIKKDDCSLVLYFADEGESVWEIAKRYSTKESLLKCENSLEEPIIDCATMLFVPTE